MPQPSLFKLGNFENIEEVDEGEAEKRGSKIKRSESESNLKRPSTNEEDLLDDNSPEPIKKTQESDGNFACTCGSALRTKIFENYDSISSIKPANYGENSGNHSKNESQDVLKGEKTLRKLIEIRHVLLELVN